MWAIFQVRGHKLRAQMAQTPSDCEVISPRSDVERAIRYVEQAQARAKNAP
jgi:hypothetical protein